MWLKLSLDTEDREFDKKLEDYLRAKEELLLALSGENFSASTDEDKDGGS